MNIRRMWLAALLLVATAAGTTVSTAAPALANPGQGPFAAVAMGDSINSGTADNSQTDQGKGVYGNTWTVGNTSSPGCHRSDSAPIFGTPPTAAVRFNIACSGAQARNVWRGGVLGGTIFKSELPQSDQLDA